MFIKWPSIENSYRQKYIDMVLEDCPELNDAQFILSEKIHGSNLQLFFEPGQNVQVGTRTRFLEYGEKFYDVWNMLATYDKLIRTFENIAQMTDTSYRVFCEYFGGRIQKGVDYGNDHKILIFGLMENDVLLSPRDMSQVLHNMGFDYMIVPAITVVSSLDKALDYPIEIDSKILNHSDNICEGVVIRPYDKVYYDGYNHPFMLKKKNDAFKEKQRVKKPQKKLDPELARLNAEFKSYITDMRLQGIFSKYGPIQEPKQIGQYIGYMMRDAKEDFLKDNPNVDNLPKKDQRSVYNVGRMIADMLKGEL